MGSAQVKNIRKKMVDIIQREVSSTDLKDVVAKLIPDSIASDIAKACQGIYPLHDVHIRKVKDAERSYRKFKLLIEEIQGKNCLTSFHGMNLTTDKLRSMVKKWQTLIEGNVDVKTTDGYMLRLFCIGFTNKDQNSQRKTCYAQHTQIKAIRKKMVDIITREVGTVDLKEVVNKLIPDSISKDIEKACQGIYPLHDVNIRKVKVLKKPKFDIGKLLELHGDGGKSGVASEGGVVSGSVDRPEGYEPPVQESV